MSDFHILPLHNYTGFIGYVVVKGLVIIDSGGRANYKTVRSYRGDSEKAYAFCSGWIEGYKQGVKNDT